MSVPTSVTAGKSFNATITGKDAFGNPANGVIYVGSSDGEIVPTATLVNGTVLDPVTLTKAGTDTIGATYVPASGSDVWADSPSFTVKPGGFASFSVVTPLSATVGLPFNVSVEAFDAYNNVIPGTVTITSTDGQKVSPATATLGTQGATNVSVTLLTADTTALVFTLGAHSITSYNITINADWFYNNMPDEGVQELARLDYNRDGSLTYDDMLAIYAKAESESSTLTSAAGHVVAVAGLRRKLHDGPQRRGADPRRGLGDPSNATYESLNPTTGAVVVPEPAELGHPHGRRGDVGAEGPGQQVVPRRRLPGRHRPEQPRAERLHADDLQLRQGDRACRLGDREHHLHRHRAGCRWRLLLPGVNRGAGCDGPGRDQEHDH